jgi:CheY-like chemotaxis protein
MGLGNSRHLRKFEFKEILGCHRFLEHLRVNITTKVVVAPLAYMEGREGKRATRRSVMRSPILLCIDDSPQLLELRKATLEHLGYCVEVATDGYKAMKILDDSPVAAVLIEYKTEGIDAEAIALHIKQRFPRQPIILLSAYSGLPDRVLWLVDEYVMRSEPLEGLAQIINRVTHQTGETRMPSVSDRFPRRGIQDRVA